MTNYSPHTAFDRYDQPRMRHGVGISTAMFDDLEVIDIIVKETNHLTVYRSYINPADSCIIADGSSSAILRTPRGTPRSSIARCAVKCTINSMEYKYLYPL
jgi:hypothetical protein